MTGPGGETVYSRYLWIEAFSDCWELESALDNSGLSGEKFEELVVGCIVESHAIRALRTLELVHFLMVNVR